MFYKICYKFVSYIQDIYYSLKIMKLISKILNIKFYKKNKGIKTNKPKPHKVVLTEITPEEIEAIRCKQYEYAV